MQKHNGLLVETITNGPFVENCFLAAEESSMRGILIDPGDEPQRILQIVQRLGVTVEAIVATHGHIDHVGAVAALKASLGVDFWVHPDDREWVASLRQQCAMFGLPPKDPPEVDHDLGECVQVGGLTARVLHTPGHSEGGSCLWFEEAGVVFVGDTLFAGSIGRTDLPGGNMNQLLSKIREQLFALPDETVVYCGHGPATTIGREKASNPFLRGRWSL